MVHNMMLIDMKPGIEELVETYRGRAFAMLNRVRDLRKDLRTGYENQGSLLDIIEHLNKYITERELLFKARTEADSKRIQWYQNQLAWAVSQIQDDWNRASVSAGIQNSRKDY